jgi:hypothetical protein
VKKLRGSGKNIMPKLDKNAISYSAAQAQAVANSIQLKKVKSAEKIISKSWWLYAFAIIFVSTFSLKNSIYNPLEASVKFGDSILFILSPFLVIGLILGITAIFKGLIFKGILSLVIGQIFTPIIAYSIGRLVFYAFMFTIHSSLEIDETTRMHIFDFFWPIKSQLNL